MRFGIVSMALFSGSSSFGGWPRCCRVGTSSSSWRTRSRSYHISYLKIARFCQPICARNKNKVTMKGRHNKREKNVKRNNQESWRIIWTHIHILIQMYLWTNDLLCSYILHQKYQLKHHHSFALYMYICIYVNNRTTYVHTHTHTPIHTYICK